MTGAVVVDASVVVSAFTDRGADGQWCADVIARDAVLAPHLMAFEVGNVLRRLAASTTISHELADIAHEALLQLPIDWWPYEAVAHRVWELRENLTVYDASYVAVAEAAGAAVATLDRRLGAAPGLACPVLHPGAGSRRDG